MDLVLIYFFQYFKKDETFFVHDPSKKCKSGDIVLIKELPQKLTNLITHSIEVSFNQIIELFLSVVLFQEIVFLLGDVKDPVTNKQVIVGKYRDQIVDANKYYGNSPNEFDYNKSTKRGKMEGKNDFSHGETYIKYHDDGTEQKFSV